MKDEWMLTVRGYYCKGCGNSLMVDEIEARLNATERLSAASARQAANWVTPKWIGVYNELTAYADILEGKDD